MSKEELKAIEKRIYELRDLCILAIQDRNFKKLKLYGIELKELGKKLRKAKKESEKNEKRN